MDKKRKKRNEYMRKYTKDYVKRHPEKAILWNLKRNDNYHFGGNRQKALERDGYKCIDCGMTDEEHRAIWKRGLTVDHKDRKGLGVSKNEKNNSLENLQTLCLKCHGKKDIQLDKASRRGLKNNATWREANKEYLQKRWHQENI